MSISTLFVEVRLEDSADKHAEAASHSLSGVSRVPFVPHILRLEADDAKRALVRVAPIYIVPPRANYQPVSSGRWTCEINEEDGRMGVVSYQEGRTILSLPYDEFLATLNTLAFFGQGLQVNDPRRFGLLFCAKSLLRFWCINEDRLRSNLVPPFDSTLK